MGNLAERLKRFDGITESARQIMVQRALKYSGATVNNNEDTNKNIRACEHAGICPATTGILIRMQDKLARLVNLSVVSKEISSDESLRDTIIDIVNYSIIFLEVYEEDHLRKAVSNFQGK